MAWVILGFGLLLAALGSAGTTALVATARRDLAEGISRRLRGASESFDWFAEVDRLVVTAMAILSLGVVLVGLAMPGIFVDASLAELAVLLLLLIIPATVLGGSLLPRLLSSQRADRVAVVVRPLLRAVRFPLQVVLPGGRHSLSEDVQEVTREGSASGLGSGEEMALVGGVMTFAERPVREVMTPRTDIVAIVETASHAEVLAAFAESGYTRLPLFRASLDEIVGMVHVFDLFKVPPDQPIPVRPVAHAPESRAAADVLLDMQRERRHFAVVIDEFGGTSGIVTLEDLLEALVGEISDDDAPGVPVPPGRSDMLDVDGGTSASEIADYFGLRLPSGEATTLAGLLVEQLGRIPVTGERFRWAGLDIDIADATPSRIERMVVRHGAPPRITIERPAR